MKVELKRALIVTIQVVTVVVTTYVISQRTSDWRLLAYWCMCAAVILFCMLSVISISTPCHPGRGKRAPGSRVSFSFIALDPGSRRCAACPG